ncbi:MAG: hypothetical protein JWM48_393 [Mycobacterium sp.]|nr:hypothetical protein [Mycobacterium sp.]
MRGAEGRGPARPRPARRRLLSGFAGPGGGEHQIRAVGTRLLLRSLVQVRLPVAVLVVAALLGTVTTVLFPAALGRAIDAVVTGHGLPGALVSVGALLLTGVVLEAVDDLVGTSVGASLTAYLRHRLLRRALGWGGAERFPPGDVLSRLAVNADSAAVFLPAVIGGVTTVLVALGGVAGLALIDWRLAVAFLLGTPVAVVVVRVFLVQAAGPSVRYQELQATLVGRLLGAFEGVRTIRASGTAEREIERILQPLPELHRLGRRVWTLQGRASWRLTLLTPAVEVLVLAVAGFSLVRGRITPGELVAAGEYVGMALGAIGLADQLVSLLGCQVGAGRVGEVLATEDSIAQPPAPRPLPDGPGCVELRGVTVRAGGKVVLDALDLTVPAGAQVALVGRSGAGRSTLVSLVGRLRDPDAGEVLLDGVPVREVALPELRRAVSYAFERPALLGATVHDTIAYARPAASRRDVVRAAVAARADSFVRKLPDGYDTPLARAPMSGGELQRLGLARAVLVAARVMVLDDATSSLDTATEAQVTRALATVLADRTCLVVAHRAATAARADLVAWLDGGRIRALAPHRALWADPAYRALFAAGGDGFADPDATDGRRPPVGAGAGP